MIHNLFVSTLCILTSMMIGCGSNGDQEANLPEVEGNNIIVSGKVQNPNNQQLRIKHAADPRGDFEKLELSSNNGFKQQLSLSSPAYFQLVSGKNQKLSLFAEPGDSIHVRWNEANFPGSVEFSGHHADENQYLAKKVHWQDSLNLLNKKAQRQLYSEKASNFTRQIDSIAKRYQRFFEDYFNESGRVSVDPTFKEFEQAYNDYRFYRIKASYPMLHKRLTRGQDANLPEDYYDFRDDVDFNDAQYLNIPTFKQYAQSRVNIEVQQQLRQNPRLQNKKAKVFTESIKETFPNDTIKAHVLGKILLQQFQRGGGEGLSEALAYYKELPNRSTVEQKLTDLEAKMEAIQPGNPAPGFTYPNIDGDTISLAELKGSYVYIDAWATWCGPCIREIPKLKKLHDEYKDENVEFVSISLDKAKDKVKWEEMVANKDLKGHQLYAHGKAFNAKLARDYMINSIPRFILIDPEGKIVDANAPRPSGNIDNKLDELLGG